MCLLTWKYPQTKWALRSEKINVIWLWELLVFLVAVNNEIHEEKAKVEGYGVNSIIII